MDATKLPLVTPQLEEDGEGGFEALDKVVKTAIASTLMEVHTPLKRRLLREKQERQHWGGTFHSE